MVEIKKGLGNRTLVSTFAGRTMPPHDQNLQKSFQVPAQEKRNFKKYPTARQKTMKMTATNTLKVYPVLVLCIGIPL